jgi:hypothetical protein
MTTEIKALRPCILPKGWVLENNIKQLDVSEIFQVSHVHYRNNEYGIVLRDREHNCLASLQLDFDETVEKDIIYPIVQLKIQEIIQAIASAQRPWLKAEGFEFVERQQYIIPYYVAGDEQDGDRIIDWYEHRGVFTFKKKERRGMGEDSEGYSLFHVTSNRFEGYNAIYSGTQYHNEVYSPKYFKPYIPYDPTDIRDQRLVKEQEAWKALEYVEVAEV